MQAGEDDELSEAADVELDALLRGLLRRGDRKVESIQEFALSGAVPLDDVNRCHTT